jgi:poly-gamma-glutamate capsule biosynthesis protein CapA/YwtB (metallophosphatase superfamily)
MEFYKHRLIAYSLGNFAGYDNFSTEGELGLSVILRVTLTARGRFEHARIYPIQLTGEGRPVPGGAAVSFTRQLSAQDFGATAARIRPSGIIAAPPP